MPLDVSNDFRVFDRTEEVTFVRVTPDGGETSYTKVKGLRRAIHGAAVTMGQAQVIPDKATWHLDIATLEVIPRRSDKIVSEGSGTWVVQNDNTETLGTRYRCECQKLEGL